MPAGSRRDPRAVPLRTQSERASVSLWGQRADGVGLARAARAGREECGPGRARAGGLWAQRVLEPAGCPGGPAAADAWARAAWLPALRRAHTRVLEPAMLRAFVPGVRPVKHGPRRRRPPSPVEVLAAPPAVLENAILPAFVQSMAFGPFICSFCHPSFTPSCRVLRFLVFPGLFLRRGSPGPCPAGLSVCRGPDT